MQNSNDSAEGNGLPGPTGYLVITGPDGQMYEIPASELKRFRIQPEEMEKKADEVQRFSTDIYEEMLTGFTPFKVYHYDPEKPVSREEYNRLLEMFAAGVPRLPGAGVRGFWQREAPEPPPQMGPSPSRSFWQRSAPMEPPQAAGFWQRVAGPSAQPSMGFWQRVAPELPPQVGPSPSRSFWQRSAPMDPAQAAGFWQRVAGPSAQPSMGFWQRAQGMPQTGFWQRAASGPTGQVEGDPEKDLEK